LYLLYVINTILHIFVLYISLSFKIVIMLKIDTIIILYEFDSYLLAIYLKVNSIGQSNNIDITRHTVNNITNENVRGGELMWLGWLTSVVNVV